MALIHADPFAHYTSAQYTDLYTAGGFGASPALGSYGRSGPGLRFTGDPAHSLERLALTTSGAVCVIQADLRISAAPSGPNVILATLLGGVIQCSLDLHADRTLAVYRGFAGTKTQLGTNSTYVVPLARHVHLGVKFTIANGTAGSIVVHVWEDGDTAAQVVLNVAGVDTQEGATATWNGVNLSAACAGTTDWSNLVVLDGSGSAANDLLGPTDVWALRASARAAPALTDWTRSAGSDSAALVDDVTPDDDGTYLEETTQHQQMAVAVDPVPVPSQAVVGAVLYASVTRTIGVPTVAAVGYESGTAHLGATAAAAATYTYLVAPYSAMPSGAAFSTAVAFDALQWGLRLTTAATGARVTQIVVAVVQARPAADAPPEYTVTIGGETGLRPLLATFRIQETIDAPDTLIADVFSVEAPYFRPTVGQSVFVTENGVRIFGGSVTGVRERGLVGPGPPKIVVEIQASSYEINAKRRVVTAAFNTGSPAGTDTIGDAFAALVADWYGELGVTLHPAQVAGPILPAASFERERGDAINAQLAGSVGYLQSIDFENRLRAWLPGDILAPENYDEGVNPELLTGDVEVERQLQNGYANRVILEGASIRINDQIDSFTGDGVLDTFPLTYRMIEHYGYVTANGIPENFGTAPGQWVLDTTALPHTIRRASGALPAGQVVTVKYNGLFVPEGLAEDAGEIATYGLWEHIEVVTAAPTTVSAQAFADALLAEKLASKDEIVTLPTRALGFHPGQVMTIATTSRDLSGEYLLTQVDTQSEAGDKRLWRRITAAKSLNNNHDWRRVYQQWAGASAEDPAALTVSTAPGSGGGGGVGLHAPTHEAGGVDPIQLDDLAAPSDTTDLNVSTTVHGLTPKITGADGVVLTKSGAAAIWATPTGGGGGDGTGLIAMRVVSTPGAGTYTPTAGTDSVILELQGGGGGGGAAASPGSGNIALGRAGGAGGYLRTRLTASFSGAAYVVGAKGAGGAAGANAGGTGTATTFTATGGGTVYTASGGVGGIAGNAATPPYSTVGGVGGGCTNGDIKTPGGAGDWGFASATSLGQSGAGGDSVLGGGGPSVRAIATATTAAGTAATGYGAGGSGCAVTTTGAAAAGGDGSDGILIIWEYGPIDGSVPSAHAPTHAAGGTDPVKLDDLAAPDDNTDLDVSSSAHGLAPKIGGALRAAADGDVLTVSGQRSVWAALPEAPGLPPNIAFKDQANVFTLTNTFAGWVRLAGSSPPQLSVHVGSGADVPFQGYEGLSVQSASGPAQISARAAGADVECGLFAHSNGNAYLGTWTNAPLIVRVNNADVGFFASNGLTLNGTLQINVPYFYVGGYRVDVTANCSIPGAGGGVELPPNLVYTNTNNPWSVYQNFPTGISVGGADVAAAIAWLNQSVKTDASPTFANLTVTSAINAPTYQANGIPGASGQEAFVVAGTGSRRWIRFTNGICTHFGEPGGQPPADEP